jgi:hypothetical protein
MYSSVYSGASPVVQPDYIQPITSAEQFRPDTPDPELDENGRYTAQSKAKRRAEQPESD